MDKKGEISPSIPGELGIKRDIPPLGGILFSPSPVDPPGKIAPANNNWLKATADAKRAGLKPLDPRRFRRRR